MADDATDQPEGIPYLTGVDGLMIDLPHRGNSLRLRCRSCQRTVVIGGHQIVGQFTPWLRAPVSEWASTLSCSVCRSRWIVVSSVADPSADAFTLSTQDDGRIVWARRLQTWLAEVGLDVRSFRDVLRDLPNEAELMRAGVVVARSP